MKYAKGNVIDSAPGYKVEVLEPWANGTATFEDGYAIFEWNPIAYYFFDHAEESEWTRDFLITLEINGKSKLYRELRNFYEDVIHDNGITIDLFGGDLPFVHDDDGTIEEGTVAKLIVEPVKVKLTDGFRAAVAEAVKTQMDAISGTLEPLIALPESEGTYVMTCDVPADGGAEITWESAD